MQNVEWEKMIMEVDENGDGEVIFFIQISFEEFHGIMF